MEVDSFIKSVTEEILRSVNNNYDDNYDFYRFGDELTQKTKGSPKDFLVNRLNKYGYYNNFNNVLIGRKVKASNLPLSDFVYLYNLLEDNESKDLLIKIIVYRMLGYKKVKLPLNTKDFWRNQHLIETKQDKDDFIQIGSLNSKLFLTDLHFLGVPIKLYYSSLGINIDFIIKQYELNRNSILIEAKEGDIVIDAGGCFGDTALYFANKVGKTGRVKVFEFIPKNVEILEKNLDLNPNLKKNIELIQNPLWQSSNQPVFFKDDGPASHVSLESFIDYSGETVTLSIDDYLERTKLSSVDFIKMDIEGAESKTLLGATETIRRFRPKLAIALYHSASDFHIIPSIINNLDCGYRFYLSHSTFHAEETVLFATVNND